MNDLLLDTHVWIWVSIERDRSLSAKARKALRQARRRLVSVISCWELAKLVEKGRISFSIPTVTWIHRSLSEFEITLADLTPEIAVESTKLQGFHHDPADQLIVATSRILGIPLVTSDRRMLDYPNVESVW